MPKVYLLLGGNLGDRNSYLSQARDRIAAQVGPIVRSSALYETAAWGNTDQPAFLNQVVEVWAEHTPEYILFLINQIEQELGRVRQEHWGARVIDIDILFYDDLAFQTPRLTIPHPRLHLRRFTLLPLAEIAPEMTHPVLGKSIVTLLENCPDELEVRPFTPVT
ncbi:2-amino-4-hydroxy-6-hydroxymethyldihydropteridine diphosphokinase [Pontibacter sp. JH31]|uniref:2-amino-4-hydroxy-6-hydroxymethyldihydropteridine pyrophosphokinase n=1 Tax=Pontibacter aquaedesilientis TaxID=2766980 RepID=A0ABR7XK40_9BACT|nr:2-amino-4-hydroxy-6-hydroxymethyldihydropteridine diphosphokinase [Pontibacter aquaedesilientis]MBD1398673.1 2-amino-4-hydroxy-6-hydroxymethyldihydropteridine diphosphokinase [Pontibacter aquaedesilientis]